MIPQSVSIDCLLQEVYETRLERKGICRRQETALTSKIDT